MARATPCRRIPRHRSTPRGPTPRRGAGGAPPRTSDLVLAVLGVVLLGGLALAAAFALASGATAS